MKALAIVIRGNDISENGFNTLVTSSEAVDNDFHIELFEAVTAPNVDDLLKLKRLKWNYPNVGSVLDPWTGMRKTAYGGRDHRKRIGCALSHFLLWEACVQTNEPLIILEHDSAFILRLDPQPLLDSKYGVIGINSPLHATFAFNRYHEMVQNNPDELQPPPMLASKEIPQGLAGNSAYVIKPYAAKHLIELCYKYGLWPNDAIMCQQLCNFLGVSKTYYTQVQGLKSTTTL